MVAFHRGDVGGLGAGQGLCDRGQAPQGPSCASGWIFADARFSTRSSKVFWDVPKFFGMFQDFTRAICRVSEDSPGLIYDFPVFRGFIGVGEIGMGCRDSLRRIAWTFICS